MIKVVYDHTSIASYQHWGVRSAGLLRICLLALDGRSAKLAGGLPSGLILFLALDGRSAELAGGLPSGPILSGLSLTGPVK
jgi:hypothetical protein